MDTTANKIEVETVVRLLRAPYHGGSWLIIGHRGGGCLRLMALGCKSGFKTVPAGAVITEADFAVYSAKGLHPTFDNNGKRIWVSIPD